MNLFQLFNRTKPGEHRIRYIVKGDVDDFNVTFKCGQECKVIQEPHIHKGWKHTFVGHNGDYIYIAAQSNKPHSAVNVLIYEDGKLIEKVTKAGDYPLVQASGTVH
ncbi:MAG: hypothetical protein M0Q51_13610 [Bacteroidales bacterium]|nr:hypothetical protein [Bacteroidales bacterium]